MDSELTAPSLVLGRNAGGDILSLKKDSRDIVFGYVVQKGVLEVASDEIHGRPG